MMARYNFNILATTPAPQAADGDFLRQFAEFAQRAERCQIDGLLIFCSHRYFDPWAVATVILQNTKAITPLVALQPYALAPFTAAKLIWSLGTLHRRRIDLNLITGASKDELDQIGEQLDHDERFERATEYMTVVRALLSSDEPLVHDGHFYRYRGLRVNARLDAEIRPRVFVAGSSAAGHKMAAAVADVAITHPEPVGQFADTFLSQAAKDVGTGIRIGLIARPTKEEAWSAARARFPEERVTRIMNAMRKRSESDWMRRLAHLATKEGVYDEVYWTGAFEKESMPTLVGTYREVADYLERYLALGVRTVILGGAYSEEDFQHVAVVLGDLRSRD
jgi:alkanesulfonate monooxygenase SsuD/methylene tetrahydromethanopterin reductase-like flavin-dependent oxidoreductase (luciferase family)